VLTDKDKSALRLFLAIFFWFVGYAAVEAFFTLYANKHLGLNEGDSATLLSVLPLLFVIFAIPSGIVASKIGRRVTISIGLVMMTAVLFCLYIFSPGHAAVSSYEAPTGGDSAGPRRCAHVDAGRGAFDVRRRCLVIR